jgi:DnaJ family protein A protein 5
VESATKQFAEVQAAHEVLSDPQERAWYDSHREAILRNDDSAQDEHFEHNVRLTSATDIVNLISKFNSSIPFNDTQYGFYGSLHIFFEKLADEEASACEWEGLDIVEYPDFGSSNDSYEEVVKPFYNVWMGFGTKKSYAWKDEHRLSEAPDRRVRRLMEKENQRLRDEGKREFNDAVRSLVAFVRKRDPRYVPNTQTEAERQKILRDAAAAQAARSRAENQARFEQHVVPEWTQSRDDDEEQIEFSESEESEVEVIECVVCNKTFKSEKQFEAHEKSKKHVKAVQQLKRQMQKENRHLNLDKESKSENSTPASEFAQEQADEVEEDNDTWEYVPVYPTDDDEEPVSQDDELPTKETPESPHAEGSNDDSSDVDDEYAPREAVENRILGQDSGAKGESLTEDIERITSVTAATSIASDTESIPQPKVGKAKAKRAKRAAKQEEEKQEGLEVSRMRIFG